jgi:hypothetical protein
MNRSKIARTIVQKAYERANLSNAQADIFYEILLSHLVEVHAEHTLSSELINRLKPDELKRLTDDAERMNHHRIADEIRKNNGAIREEKEGHYSYKIIAHKIFIIKGDLI